jgi:hypothetical protein
MGLFSGTGLTPSLKGVVSNVVTLKAGQVQIIQPAGWYMIRTGIYSTLQQFDPITQIWRNIGGGVMAGGLEYIYADGVNYRIANQNGCAVGAVLTNVGSGYTSAPTVTASAGSSVWKAIVGGAVNQTVTVSNAGTNYTYPPIVQISAPPAGGVQATAYATLSGSTVSTVTLVDQGAGYTAAPTIVFVNDPREGLNGTTVGAGATATATLTGSQTITALLCLDHGNPIAFTAGSATTLPTLSFSGGGGSSAAATTVMNWSITGLQSGTYANGTSGVGGAGGTQVIATGVDQPATANSTVLNVQVQAGLVRTRQALLTATAAGGTLPAYTAWVVRDGGVYTGTPLLNITANTSVAAGALVTALATMGYFSSDTSYMTQL